MSEYEVSRVVQAPRDAVFAMVADPARLPEWLPTVELSEARLGGDGTELIHVEGDAGGGHYESEGFWRPEAEQLRVEWGTPSRGGEPSHYAGWLQVADSGQGGAEVTLHLSFLAGATPPPGVEQALAGGLEALADIVETQVQAQTEQ